MPGHERASRPAAIVSVLLFILSLALWTYYGRTSLASLSRCFAPHISDAPFPLLIAIPITLLGGVILLGFAVWLALAAGRTLPVWFRLLSLLPGALALMCGLAMVIGIELNPTS